MPNPDEQERKGKNNAARLQALLTRAQSNSNPQSWSEWWSAGISRLGSAGSAVKSGAQHAILHTTAKLVMYGVATFVVPVGWIGAILAWGSVNLASHLGEEALEKLADYGGGIAEDWVKSFAEEGAGKVASVVTGEAQPSPAEQREKNLREATDKMFATIGALDIIMRQMDGLQGKPLTYCDDGNLVARLQVRIDTEIASAKTQVSQLQKHLSALQKAVAQFENRNNQNRAGVIAAIKQVLKAGATDHWSNTYSDTLKAMYRCSRQHCFGPGTGSPANDNS